MTQETTSVERKLDGKVVVITGGSTGIGRACAAEYARSGAVVVIGDVDEIGAAGDRHSDRVGGTDGTVRFVRCVEQRRMRPTRGRSN